MPLAEKYGTRRGIDVAEEIVYKYTIARSGSRQPLTIYATIQWLEGDEGDALRNAQARVLRGVLAEIARQRHQQPDGSQEQP
jgi:hypothetical protein